MQPTHPAGVLGWSLHVWLQLTGQLETTRLDSILQARHLKSRCWQGHSLQGSALPVGVPLLCVRGGFTLELQLYKEKGGGSPHQHSWLLVRGDPRPSPARIPGLAP